MHKLQKLLTPLFISMLGALWLLGGASLVSAEEDDDVIHKIVIQVSTDDPRTQTIALNNAINLQKYYGMDDVIIEVVAYGPGLGLLTKASKQATRVESLAMQDITFTACANTIEAISKKTGKKPELLADVGIVKAGVARIMELQEQGYSYIRP